MQQPPLHKYKTHAASYLLKESVQQSQYIQFCFKLQIQRISLSHAASGLYMKHKKKRNSEDQIECEIAK